MSYIECANGHPSNGKIRDAAICISEQHEIGRCKKCGEQLRCFVQHSYANDRSQTPYRYEVVRASRLNARVDGEGNDPFLLVLRDLNSGEEAVWPVFWGRDQNNKWRVGQWAPILRADEWRILFDRL
jgi:hypothetical protein